MYWHVMTLVILWRSCTVTIIYDQIHINQILSILSELWGIEQGGQEVELVEVARASGHFSK